MTEESGPGGPTPPEPPAPESEGAAPARRETDATGLAPSTRSVAEELIRTIPPPPAKPADAQRLLAGRYRLEGLLGRGSMGAVWRAHDTILRRSVAVKEVLLPPTQTEEDNEIARERALREARAIAALSHPNVVTLYDVVEEDGRPWVVMELVPAQSLAEIIRDKGPLSPPEAARIGLAVLGALDAAHQVGITHRDVKPGNILVSTDGRVKLADFGISRKVDESQLTRTGLMVGSPSYIAPEVARGKEAGQPADIWGLGATLHCAVEGTPPFDLGDPVATLTAVVGQPPRPAPHAGPLAPVIGRMLVKDPRQRITVEDLRRSLTDVVGRPAERTATLPAAHPLSAQTVARAVQNAGPPRPPAYRPAVGPAQRPPAYGPPVRGPATAPPRSALRPVPPPKQSNALTWVAAAVAVVLIVGAVVAVLLVNKATGRSQGSGGSGSSQTSTPTSSGTQGGPSSTAIKPTISKDGTVAAGIQIGESWYGFGLQVPSNWALNQPSSSRVELVPLLDQDLGSGSQTKITVVAEPYQGPSVSAQLESQNNQDGSPAQLPNYTEVAFEASDSNAVRWEYAYTTPDGQAKRYGYTYAVRKGDILWRVLIAGPQAKKAKLGDLYDDVVGSFTAG